MMRFSTFLRTAYVRGHVLFLLPLACLPTLAFPFEVIPIEMQKGIFAAFLLGGVVFLYGVALLLGQVTLRIPKHISVPFLFLFLLYVILLGWASSSSAWQLFGLSFEIGTVGSFLLFGIAFFLGSTLGPRHLGTGIYLWLATAAFAGCVALLSYMFGGREDFSTLAGAWPQLSFVLASALLASIIFFEDASWDRVRPLIAIAFFFALFACFFHSAAAIALFAALIIFIAFSFYKNRRIPLSASAIAGIIAILLVVGMRTPLLSMPPDIRLSFFLNEIILAPVYISNTPQALFGAGPGNFSTLWEMNRPYEFNQTPLWDRTFTQGYSTLGTFLAEMGFVGMLALLFVLGSFIVSYLSRVRRNSGESFEEDAIHSALALVVIFLFVAAAIYTIHLVLFLLGALALGAWARLFSSDNIALSLRTQKLMRVFGGGTAAFLGILLIWIAILQFFAAREYVQGLAASGEQNFTEAAERFTHAASLWPAPLYHRDASRALLEQAASSASVESAEFKSLAANAVTHADNAALYGPKDYWNWISKSSVYVSLYSLGFVELEEETEIALQQARSLSPSRPEPLYLDAVFSFRKGDEQSAQAHLSESLRLKPDYTEALELKRVLDSRP